MIEKSEPITILGDDITVICGKRRGGKTYWMKHAAKPFKKRIVYDTNWEHDDMGFVVSSFRDMWLAWKKGFSHLVFRNDRMKNPDYFDMFMHEIHENYKYLVVIVEEIETYEKTHFATEYFKKVLDYGRPQKHIGLMCTARRISDMNPSIPFNADHIIVFRTHRPQDLKLLDDWMGKSGVVYKIRTAPEFSFVYYNGNTGTSELKEKIS